ncbi:cyclin-C [Zalerion maritima]|uniref:RNA polymerase II holoenzyme cyclin-like subunit n=1 Tax=Zalerion maritima TaxID=339359 RepID=A0AAD5RND9_9PEZI|nr:cyclin-C [Zalerion maritima]
MAANYWESSQRRHWTFTKEQLAEKRQALEDADQNLVQMYPLPNARHLGIFFNAQINRLGKRLGVRQQAIATAQLYLKRFYTKVDIRRTNPYLLVATSLYLACKMEECPQHIRLVVTEARSLWHEFLSHTDTSKLGECEFFLISEMNSHLIVHQPYRTLTHLQQEFGLNPEEHKFAWTMINDHYMTDLPLLHPPHIIALTTILLSIVLKNSNSLAPNSSNMAAAALVLTQGGRGGGSYGGGDGHSSARPNKMQKLALFLAESNVDVEAMVDCTQELIALYETLEPRNDRTTNPATETKDQINRYVKARVLTASKTTNFPAILLVEAARQFQHFDTLSPKRIDSHRLFPLLSHRQISQPLVSPAGPFPLFHLVDISCSTKSPSIATHARNCIIMSANQLYLLADHIKLSLLERQRAQSLNLPSVDKQDSQISQSLHHFKSGLESLEKENKRLVDAGDAENAGASASSLSALRKQLDDLTSQFHGFSSPSTADTLSHPNDPSLQGDFEHAQSNTSAGGSSFSQQQQPRKTSLRTTTGIGGSPDKTVRFSDNPQATSAANDEAELFGRYRDDPAAAESRAGAGNEYANTIEQESMNNVQVHAYHGQVLRDQDDQLDTLGATIGRQRELSMRIGDELDSHVQLLDQMDTHVDRHAGRLDTAKKGIRKVVKGVGESKQMMIIIALIVILILLIAITK